MGEECRMTPPKLGPKFEEALLFAFRTHNGQLRKGADKDADPHADPGARADARIPYIAHLLSVCALVLEDAGDEDEAIAALLHDTLEDHPEKVKASDLARRFGPRVRDLVVACTDTPPDYTGGPKAEWPVRKAAYVEQIRAEKYPLCRIALADKLHNTRAIALDHRRFGDEVWERFNATKEEELRYHRDLVDAFREAKAPEYLVDELDSLVKELEAFDA
jgi:(p)ppGpp synthase/HD superfamily hydrolase